MGDSIASIQHNFPQNSEILVVVVGVPVACWGAVGVRVCGWCVRGVTRFKRR